MQDVLGQVMQLSATPSRENLNKMLKVLNDGSKAIKKNAHQIDQACNEILTLPQNTMAVVYFLNIKSGFEVKDQNLFLEQIRRVLLNGDIEQIAYVPSQFSAIARTFTNAVMWSAPDRWVRGVAPLQAGIRLLQGTNANLLTSLHANFAQVCLKAKVYNAALPVLENPVYEIKKENGIEPADYLQYFYYGGMIYCGLKKFTKAQEFFQLALTAPSKVLSAIQVEAYKKYVCCSLIETGEIAPLPGKLTSPVVARNVVRLAGHYEAFSRALKQGVDAAHKVFAEHLDTFRKDKNMGLLKQSVEAMARRNIQRLTSTYVTLSLAEIKSSANVKTEKEAEKILVGMIDDGVLSAQISQKDGMVIFHEQPDELDTSKMISELDTKIREVIALSDKLKLKEKDIVLNIKYVVKTTPGLAQSVSAAQGQMGGGMGGGMGGPMGMMGMGMMGGPGGFAGAEEDMHLRMALEESRQMQGGH